MCLNAFVTVGQKIQIATVKGLSWWAVAKGEGSEAMAAKSKEIKEADNKVAVAQLPTFTPVQAVDYAGYAATLASCATVDMRVTATEQASLLDDAETEHVYQLNHVYVPAPAPNHDVLFDKHLFAVLDCWDFSKKVQLPFRQKALLNLAQMDPQTTSVEDYTSEVTQGNIRHPVMATLRVRIKKAAPVAENLDDDTPAKHRASITALVVEAEPMDFTSDNGIPSDALHTMGALLAAGGTSSSERLLAATLDDLTPSPWCNMCAQTEPTEKALVLLRFAQRSVGSQDALGFRILTDEVYDAVIQTVREQPTKYQTIARCSLPKSPDYTAAKNSCALAVIHGRQSSTVPYAPCHRHHPKFH